MIDFFDKKFVHEILTDKTFGLVDGLKETPAFVDLVFIKKWNAKVENDSQKEISFTPIDYNIIIYKDDAASEKESTCDCMLILGKSLFLIELKDMNSGAESEGKPQLINTIKLIEKYHPDYKTKFKTRKAFVCNKAHKHRPFKSYENDENVTFHNEYGFHYDNNFTIRI
jgi:hypothetical protein